MPKRFKWKKSFNITKAMFLARKRGMNAKVVDKNLVVNNVYNLDNIPDNLKESSTLNSS